MITYVFNLAHGMYGALNGFVIGIALVAYIAAIWNIIEYNRKFEATRSRNGPRYLLTQYDDNLKYWKSFSKNVVIWFLVVLVLGWFTILPFGLFYLKSKIPYIKELFSDKEF